MKKTIAAAALAIAACAQAATPADKLTVPAAYTNAAGKTLLYRWAEPENAAKGRKYPLVLFFHGAGERGDDNTRQLVHGTTDILNYMAEKKIEGYFIAPQCPEGKQWVDTPWGAKAHTMPETPSETMALAMELVEKTMREKSVDPGRVLVTGLSMGGYGTWDIVQRRPEWFAAAMPCCGGGDPSFASAMKNVNIWAFHGEVDNVVPVTRSRDMGDALKAAGGKVRYREYPGVGHGCWQATYANGKVLSWFFAQRKKPWERRGGNSRWVRTETGTSFNGHTFVAAAYPFGLLQPGPDTGRDGWDYCSGFRWDDTRITGFSQTHLNGTGCPDLGDIRLMPFAGEPSPDVSSAYRKDTLVSEPGYCGVFLDGCRARVETAAAAHSAIYKISYAGKTGKLLLDFQHGIGWDLEKSILSCTAAPDGDRRITGTTRRKGWVDREYSYWIEFNVPFSSCETLPKAFEGEKAPRFALSFDFPSKKPLLVKIGYSTVDVEGAKRNLDAEIPAFDFGKVRAAARKEWNALLGRIEIEGDAKQKINFYTSLYHAFIQPNNIADVDGRYRGADGAVAKAADGEYYSTLSLWDTFRAANPLYTIIAPEKVGAMVSTMVEHARAAGYLPIWTLMGKDNQCMIGTHSVPVIVDAYLKGFKGFDPEAAYAAIRSTLREAHPGRHKENWDLLDKYGYYPFDMIKGESVSRTMECAYDDWCAGIMAEKLGHADDAAFFFRRSQNWKNVFDPSIGLVRGRDSKGAWREPYNPFALGHGAGLANDFTEGNAFQYTWHVMQDSKGLAGAMGGADAFVKRLDSLFEQPETTEGAGFVADVTGLVGQYVQGNEPSHHVIYFYPQFGHPEKTAERVREVFDKFFLPKPDGLCGNDDCGQMSAWYVFSAMGFYPFNPCGGEYILGAPQIPSATLKTGGKKFRVVAKNLSEANKYVKSVSLNGKKIDGFSISHADVANGGELVFEMAPQP